MNEPRKNVEHGAKSGVIATLAALAGSILTGLIIEKNPSMAQHSAGLTAAIAATVGAVLGGIVNWFKHRD